MIFVFLKCMLTNISVSPCYNPLYDCIFREIFISSVSLKFGNTRPYVTSLMFTVVICLKLGGLRSKVWYLAWQYLLIWNNFAIYIYIILGRYFKDWKGGGYIFYPCIQVAKSFVNVPKMRMISMKDFWQTRGYFPCVKSGMGMLMDAQNICTEQWALSSATFVSTWSWN